MSKHLKLHPRLWLHIFKRNDCGGATLLRFDGFRWTRFECEYIRVISPSRSRSHVCTYFSFMHFLFAHSFLTKKENFCWLCYNWESAEIEIDWHFSYCCCCCCCRSAFIPFRFIKLSPVVNCWCQCYKPSASWFRFFDFERIRVQGNEMVERKRESEGGGKRPKPDLSDVCVCMCLCYAYTCELKLK